MIWQNWLEVFINVFWWKRKEFFASFAIRFIFEEYCIKLYGKGQLLMLSIWQNWLGILISLELHWHLLMKKKGDFLASLDIRLTHLGDTIRYPIYNIRIYAPRLISSLILSIVAACIRISKKGLSTLSMSSTTKNWLKKQFFPSCRHSKLVNVNVSN